VIRASLDQWKSDVSGTAQIRVEEAEWTSEMGKEGVR
jgi:hypothetical protein